MRLGPERRCSNVLFHHVRLHPEHVDLCPTARIYAAVRDNEWVPDLRGRDEPGILATPRSATSLSNGALPPVVSVSV